MHGGRRAEISKLVAMLGSLEEVEQVLSEARATAGLQGHSDDRLSFRHAYPSRPTCGQLGWGEPSRAVAWSSTDGNRMRIRTIKRGPKAARDATAILLASAKPKLLIIYVVDEKGQMDREFLAVIDGTLGGPEAIFKLMEFYLRELKITTADKILFVADGARWIWNRVGAMLARLGVKPEQINELVDFYHAVEHLGKIAALALLDGGGASGGDRSPTALPAETRDRGGGSGDRSCVWFSPRQGVETGARLLQTERRQRTDGLRAGGGVEVADRQRCDRECDSPCRELAVEGAEHLLAQRRVPGRSVVTFVPVGRTMEPS